MEGKSLEGVRVYAGPATSVVDDSRRFCGWLGWIIGRGKNRYTPYYVPAGHLTAGFQRIRPLRAQRGAGKRVRNKRP